MLLRSSRMVVEQANGGSAETVVAWTLASVCIETDWIGTGAAKGFIGYCNGGIDSGIGGGIADGPILYVLKVSLVLRTFGAAS